MNTIDNTQLQTFKDCPLKYRFRFELGLGKIEEDEVHHHVMFGQAIHAGLEAYYKGSSMEEVKRVFSQGYPKQLDGLDKAKTQENGLIILNEYVKRYKQEDSSFKVLAVEEVNRIAVNDRWELVTKSDLIYENTQFGGIYVTDHKTTGKNMDYHYWGQFEPNSQVNKNLITVGAKYGEVAGFRVNAIRLGHRMRAYKGQPAGFYWEFARMEFNSRPEILEYELKDTRYWIERIEHARLSGHWAMNTNSCRFCEFKSVCTAGWTWESDRDQILIGYEVKDRKAYLKENEPDERDLKKEGVV